MTHLATRGYGEAVANTSSILEHGASRRMALCWQPSLLDAGAAASAAIDESFRDARREHLDLRAWVEHYPGWVSGAGASSTGSSIGRRGATAPSPCTGAWFPSPASPRGTAPR